TLYQLYAHARAGLPADAAHLLLIPDLCHHYLCGAISCERTNASTTQLLSAESGDWDTGLFEELDLPRWLMAPLVDAGTTLGTLRFLKNVMGLWLLESCRKEWMAAGYRGDMPALLEQVAKLPGFVGFINPDAPRFFNPVSMNREVRAALTETGQPSPVDPARL